MMPYAFWRSGVRTMNISGFSDNGLLSLQKSIYDAVEKDDAVPVGQDKIYGAREFTDWKEMCDALEAELDERRLNYQKVIW
jgi:hypothetical protein